MIPAETCHYYCISEARRALPRCLITEKLCLMRVYIVIVIVWAITGTGRIEEIVKARLAYALRRTVKQHLNEKCPERPGHENIANSLLHA